MSDDRDALRAEGQAASQRFQFLTQSNGSYDGRVTEVRDHEWNVRRDGVLEGHAASVDIEFDEFSVNLPFASNHVMVGDPVRMTIKDGTYTVAYKVSPFADRIDVHFQVTTGDDQS